MKLQGLRYQLASRTYAETAADSEQQLFILFDSPYNSC